MTELKVLAIILSNMKKDGDPFCSTIPSSSKTVPRRPATNESPVLRWWWWDCLNWCEWRSFKEQWETDVTRDSQREKKAGQWFTINTLVCIDDVDDRTLKKHGRRIQYRLKTAMHAEIETIDQMWCWDSIPRIDEKRRLHAKYIIGQVRNKRRLTQHYKANLDVVGGEAIAFNKDSFCSVAEYIIAKLIMCLALKNA